MYLLKFFEAVWWVYEGSFINFRTKHFESIYCTYIYTNLQIEKLRKWQIAEQCMHKWKVIHTFNFIKVKFPGNSIRHTLPSFKAKWFSKLPSSWIAFLSLKFRVLCTNGIESSNYIINLFVSTSTLHRFHSHRTFII